MGKLSNEKTEFRSEIQELRLNTENIWTKNIEELKYKIKTQKQEKKKYKQKIKTLEESIKQKEDEIDFVRV